MAVLRSDCKVVEEQEGLPGGVTYHVILPGANEPRPTCFRRRRDGSDLRCTNVAGGGTYHKGTGACKYHGGNNRGVVTTGKKAVMTKARLAGDIQRYLNQDRKDLLDLTYELAATRVIFKEFLDYFTNPEDEHYDTHLIRMQGIVGTIGNLVDRISKIDSRNTLTTAQVLYLRATIADLLFKYIPDEESREQAARELASRMGGEVSETIEIRSSEVGPPVLSSGE